MPDIEEDKSPVITWSQFARVVAVGTALSAVTAAIASAGFLYANFSDGQTKIRDDLGRVWSTMADVRADVGRIQGAILSSDAKVQTALSAIDKENSVRDGRIQGLHDNYVAAAEAMSRLSATMAATIQSTDGKVDSLIAQTNKLEVAVARIETAVKYGGKPDGSNTSPGPGR